jgi:hypothetical protein
MPPPPHIQAIPPYGQSSSTTKTNDEAVKQARIDTYENMTRVEHHPKLARQETFEDFQKRREREEAYCHRGQELWDGKSSEEIAHGYKVERDERLKEVRKNKEKILEILKSRSRVLFELEANAKSQSASGGS